MPKFFNSAVNATQRNIPTISTPSELEGYLKLLRGGRTAPTQPKIPWNFTVVNKQGGNLLSWSAVTGADGYVVEIATTPDFSALLSSVSLKGNGNIQYFDNVGTAQGATPQKRYYRVRATAGTIATPQSTQGLATGTVSATAISPNDTATAPTTTRDTTTSDSHQASTRNGNYLSPLKNSQ